MNLREILEARETRAEKQRGLLSRGGVLVSFGLNIPGPVKNAKLYRMVFEEGLKRLRTQEALRAAWEEDGSSAAGPCAFFLIRGEKAASVPENAAELKKKMMRLEEETELGRLFDIDVLYRGADGFPEKISRSVLGGTPRKCLVCGEGAFVCVRAARHPVPEVLMKVIGRILRAEAIQKQLFQTETLTGAEAIALEAVRAILCEVITTPKPGLVDAENNGAHGDMDITTFFDSAVAIAPYFRDCARIGMDHAAEPEETLLPLLRPPGMKAETEMYRATGGVNTHKGAIFTLGLFCAAAGICLAGRDLKRDTAGTGGAGTAFLAEKITESAGKIASSMQNGTRGIRNEATGGYPSLAAAMKAVFAEGEAAGIRFSGPADNSTGVQLLMELMSRVDDSNVVRRKGEAAAASLRDRAGKILKERKAAEICGGKKAAQEILLAKAAELDRELIRENISPGGSADLLAAAYFLLSITQNRCERG